jgi:hypothetical protein
MPPQIIEKNDTRKKNISSKPLMKYKDITKKVKNGDVYVVYNGKIFIIFLLF